MTGLSGWELGAAVLRHLHARILGAGKSVHAVRARRYGWASPGWGAGQRATIGASFERVFDAGDTIELPWRSSACGRFVPRRHERTEGR